MTIDKLRLKFELEELINNHFNEHTRCSFDDLFFNKLIDCILRLIEEHEEKNQC